MTTIFQSTLADTLKETLNDIVDDNIDGAEDSLLLTKWMNVQSMKDAYVDDLEMAGPGLLSEKPEGSEIQAVGLREGFINRYWARTFGGKMIITEEAMDDSKYDRAIRLALRLKYALFKTADIDATNVLVRGFNTSFVYGDGQCLFSASHPLAGGGTFSNTMATPMSPSRAAMIILTTQMGKAPGHDGVIAGYKPVCIVCPFDQWAVWEGVTGSSHAPEPGAFNEINVINKQNLDVVPIPYWSNTTTNWAALSKVDNGINWKWRKRPSNRAWVDNDNQVMKYSISARWARGVSDPRGAFGVNA